MRLFIIALLLVSTSAFGCPSGGGAEIKVTGIATLEILPGPPNYESIESGDREDKYWFVKTKISLCFSPDTEFMEKKVTSYSYFFMA